MTNILNSNITLLITRIILGMIFILAGIEKVANPADFSEAVANYRVVPLFLQNIIAISIPWIELVSGVLLIFGKWIKENSLLLSALLLVFNILVLQAIIRGLDIDCGCFGTLDAQTVGLRKLAENFALLVVGLLLYFFPRSEKR